jgi:hypothetical protein
MKDNFFVNAPLRSSGSTTKSGWMTEKDFVLFLEHLVKHIRPSVDKPALWTTMDFICPWKDLIMPRQMAL